MRGVPDEFHHRETGSVDGDGIPRPQLRHEPGSLDAEAPRGLTILDVADGPRGLHDPREHQSVS
jgi:hypothetical protein